MLHAEANRVETSPAPPAPPADPGPTRRSRDLLRRAALACRPVAIAVAVFGVVVAVVAIAPEGSPFAPTFRYGLEVMSIGVVAVGAALTWWAWRRGRTWDADVMPGLFGGVAALSLLGMLRGTPWGPNGLLGDPSFRTETVTRFAHTWSFADFTYHGLPAFYAPAYFWVLGRVADLADIEPWRMVKYGNVVATMFVPLVCYLMWRRLVPPRVAALIAAVPLVVENFYEPYSWLVLVAIVPWWFEAVHGLTRPGLRQRNPVMLGLVGAVLFMTYYYFFFVAAIALVIFLVVERLLGQLDRARLARVAVVLVVAAAGSAVYWLPLGLSILRASAAESLANRWFFPGANQTRFPFLEVSVEGVVALVGLGFLVLTARKEPLSRALAVFLAAAYAWYVVGMPAAALDKPLLTFRGAPLVPLILLYAGVLGLVRLAQLARDRFDPAQATKLAALAAVVLVFSAAHGFTVKVATNSYITAAHEMPYPDGHLPRYHPAGAAASSPVTAVQDAIDARYAGSGQPVVLTERYDLLALNPYYGFVQWHAYYSHPAGEFHARIAFLKQLATAGSAVDFADRSADNRFDRIDAFVLKDEGQQLTFNYRDDNFPNGSRPGAVRFPVGLISAEYFDIVRVDGWLVAVRREAR
jgi:galactan 5-O-arabinofuranosyltransferase